MIYDTDRPEMLQLIPASARKVLDVGCATGRFGESLRTLHPAMEVWGIDPTPHPADRPQPYRNRLVGTYPESLPASETFDCVVFNDVLEHLVDPWSALRQTHAHLRPGGSIVISIPNVRHIWVLRPLLLEGKWEYQDWGILDRTHLRFFTRSSAIALVESSGFHVDEVRRIQWEGGGGRVAFANRILRGRLDDFLAQQFAMVAHPSERPSPDTAPVRALS